MCAHESGKREKLEVINILQSFHRMNYDINNIICQ